MSMLSWTRENNLPNLILFVHGLKGGVDTWSYSDEISFPLLIKNDSQFTGSYDIACFDYFTTFTTTYGTTKNIFRKLFKSKKAVQKNLPVQELAELLNTEIKVSLCGYENIYIIAHSMGGLISKACILQQLEDDQITPVSGFISLAVPHSGAKIANIGDLISSNVQMKDLSVLSDATDKFTREWISAPTKPKSKYIYGAHDKYVEKKSALAIGSLKQDSLAVNEDHFSICKPENEKQTIYKSVVKCIEEFSSQVTAKLDIETLIDGEQYDDEYFVLKMLLADIDEGISCHAKEYFFNAELMRKVFTSDNDRKALDTLYKKIKHLYQEEYGKYLASGKTSDEFIVAVHSRIMKEESNYLQFITKNIDNLHKKGMLHQIANSNSKEVIWSKDTSISDINSIKEQINCE